MGSRFVHVRASSLLAEMRDIGAKIQASGGSFSESRSAREIVFDLVPRHGRAMVRVYTSLAIGSSALRDVGRDAIRLIVCVEHPEGFRKLEPVKRLFRTAPAASSEGAREAMFLERLRVELRAAFALAVSNEPCPRCGRATADRGKFRGCSGFPECRGTLPKRRAA